MTITISVADCEALLQYLQLGSDAVIRHHAGKPYEPITVQGVRLRTAQLRHKLEALRDRAHEKAATKPRTEARNG